MSKTVKEAVVEEVAGEAVRLLFDKYDTDADGRLQKEEFMRVALGGFSQRGFRLFPLESDMN